MAHLHTARPLFSYRYVTALKDVVDVREKQSTTYIPPEMTDTVTDWSFYYLHFIWQKGYVPAKATQPHMGYELLWASVLHILQRRQFRSPL